MFLPQGSYRPRCWPSRGLPSWRISLQWHHSGQQSSSHLCNEQNDWVSLLCLKLVHWWHLQGHQRSIHPAAQHSCLHQIRWLPKKGVPYLCSDVRKAQERLQEGFKAVLDPLPSTIIRTVTLNFEAAMWLALTSVIPQVTLLGCYFHWSQAVWRKVQELGLQTAYNTDDNTYKFICKLLSLPYLPAQHITTVFNTLQQRAATQPLQDLIAYISTTWLQSSIWPTTSWSVFGHYTRTNNDVEGWHFRINKKGQLPFYILIIFLHEEAKQLKLQVHLVSENKLSQRESLQYWQVQSAIFSAWDDYTSGRVTPSQLLKASSKHVHIPN